MRRALALMTMLCAAYAASISCAAGGTDDETACAVGSEGCPCTNGGACDEGLTCLSDLCVNANPEGGSNQGGNGSGGEGSGAFNAGGSGGGGQCAQGGCKAIDVLFAMDGSGSMTEEIHALSATQSFTAVINALANINCGDIDYRIGVTDDYHPTFVTPGNWTGPKPWFDSTMMSDDEIAAAFSGAANAVISGGGAGDALGCEHVLTNSKRLLGMDTTGFLRPNALLVLVLVSDVDDYGAYDQIDGNSCGIGCSEPFEAPADIYSALIGMKGGDPKGVSAIVVAGDPGLNGGLNFCDQPASCGCDALGDCAAFHADRLWAFAGLQAGSNGYTGDLCQGVQAVPNSVQTALTSNIDLACEEFEPPM